MGGALGAGEGCRVCQIELRLKPDLCANFTAFILMPTWLGNFQILGRGPGGIARPCKGEGVAGCVKFKFNFYTVSNAHMYAFYPKISLLGFRAGF